MDRAKQYILVTFLKSNIDPKKIKTDKTIPPPLALRLFQRAGGRNE
jgi:hypothetical protein